LAAVAARKDESMVTTDGGGASAPASDEGAVTSTGKPVRVKRVKDPAARAAKSAAKKARKRLKAKMLKGKAGQPVRTLTMKLEGPKSEARTKTFTEKTKRAQLENELGAELNKEMGKT
jgi:hypothetical protein